MATKVPTHSPEEIKPDSERATSLLVHRDSERKPASGFEEEADFVLNLGADSHPPHPRPTIDRSKYGTWIEDFADGGLSTTFLVKKPDGRLVVVKTIGEPAEEDRAKKIRLLKKEYDYLKRIHDGNKNAHWVKPLAFHEEGALELEFIPHRLDHKLADISQRTPRERLKVMRQIAVAVKEAHDVGIIDRDLKPKNIGMDKDGEIVMFDLGVAGEKGKELEDLGDYSGTPYYSSDEMLAGDPIPRPTDDTHALMLTFQELLYGQGIGAQDTAYVAKRDVISGMPAIKELTASLATIYPEKYSDVESILAWHKFKDADELIEAIDQANKYLEDPDKFFKEFYGPKILEAEIEPKKLNRLVFNIFTAREVWERLVTDKLGISMQRTSDFFDEAIELGKQAERETLRKEAKPDLQGGFASPHRSRIYYLKEGLAALAKYRAEKEKTRSSSWKMPNLAKPLLSLIERLRPKSAAAGSEITPP